MITAEILDKAATGCNGRIMLALSRDMRHERKMDRVPALASLPESYHEVCAACVARFDRMVLLIYEWQFCTFSRGSWST